MALMLGKLYDALRQGGVPDDKAREAAEEVAGYEREIAGLRTEIGGLRTEVRVGQAILGVAVVLLGALLWQFVGLSGRVDTGFAHLDERLAAIERRLP